MSRWALYGLYAWAAFQGLESVVAGFVARRAWKTFDNWFHQVRANPPGQAPPALPSTFSGLQVVVELTSLAVIVAGIAVLIWQHSTAEVARELGYPAKRSPALGTGSWFIPIVNFWFPYQSLRDLLPPGHPGRKRALVAWLLYVADFPLLIAGVVLAVRGSSLTPLPYLLAAACHVGAAAIGGQLIKTVDAEHGRRIAGGLGQPREPGRSS
jgi:hypothetical protein